MHSFCLLLLSLCCCWVSCPYLWKSKRWWRILINIWNSTHTQSKEIVECLYRLRKEHFCDWFQSYICTQPGKETREGCFYERRLEILIWVTAFYINKISWSLALVWVMCILCFCSTSTLFFSCQFKVKVSFAVHLWNQFC